MQVERNICGNNDKTFGTYAPIVYNVVRFFYAKYKLEVKHINMNIIKKLDQLNLELYIGTFLARQFLNIKAIQNGT